MYRTLYPARIDRLAKFAAAGALLLGALCPGAQARSNALAQLLEQDWQWQMQHNPGLATEVGDMRYNHRLGDVSPQGLQAELAQAKKVLQQAKRLPVKGMDAQEQLSRTLFISEKEKQLQAAVFYPYQVYPIGPQNGVHVEVMQLVEKMPFKTAHDYQNYIARLNAVPAYIDGLIAQLDAGVKAGWVAPKAIIANLPQQIRQIGAQLEQSALAQPLQKMPASFSATQQAAFKAQVERSLQQQLRPAFAKLAEHIEQKYLPACRDSIAASQLPGGRAYYQFLAQNFTTTQMTPEQIHALGVQEVARIQAQMRQIMQQTGFKGDFKQFVHKLNTEPQFFYTKPEDLLQGYSAIIARAHVQLPKLFARLPKSQVSVKAVPAVGAENQGGAYYESGTPDGSRPGYFVANASKLDTRPKWKMETLTLHEAEPGHHLQTALAQEVEELPNFRRFGWYVAFGEGWALYAESLGEDMGLYTDPYSMFGHLDDELFRAARLVVDTGMHALGWSRQQAIDYMNDNTANPPDDNVVEIDRYIAWPGQALGYKIGQLKILQLREQAKAALGKDFDIRQFHQVLLGNGALPLDLVEKQILAWQQKTLDMRKK